ncbi:TetR family transcriptional regulator [Micromonospora pisi]|uniref:TetR family transcriptional regulator n=1 Tax=Micromonospora pisi TaxID=589240 RepID=A0A495JQW8_9ACTN|nr:TetR/AcrR family transcriptional regulator [Micromonospora pisi]RKR91241.1 TetR family transcriptional regulator [Micromonospora pisi]
MRSSGGISDEHSESTGEHEPALPAAVRVSLPAPTSSRGPAPTYSRAQVAAAAIRIADEQGIEAVSMRKVAAALGTGPMSLYRYVDNKEALCELMLDHMFGETELPEPTGDWRVDLAEVARSLRRSQLRHPWLARIAAGRPAMGPNMLEIFEYGMSVLDRLGLDIADMLEIFSLVSSWVGGFVQEEVAELAARRDRGMDEREWRRGMARHLETLTGGGDYPYLARVMRAGADRDFDTRFERGLDRIIAGIGATLPPTAD